ncbi:unnamed protein product [Calicophoron daubneyi]|uniref:Phosphatidylinositol-specific phospholipase C X domain-containing protein n=1 Tax=Calicophoron daubneyi TaxID=300641 RepID=A0AAV2T603_CALDB
MAGRRNLARHIPINFLNEWMSHLPPAVASQPLNWIAIPGSHDSFTYAITSKSKASSDAAGYEWIKRMPIFLVGPTLSRWTITQCASFYEQLQGGIRYFDLRVGVLQKSTSDREFFFVHGQYALSIVTGLESIREFLREHPKEVVILDCNHSYDIESEEETEEVENLFVKILGNLLCPYRIEVPSLELMWRNGYQVIFFSCVKQAVDKLPLPQLWPQFRIKSWWPETEHVHEMVTYLNEHYGPSLPRCPDMFYVHQGVLTPTTKYVLHHLHGSVRLLAQKAGTFFEDWLVDPERVAGPNGVNITIIDFCVTDFPDYAAKVINLNFRTWPTDKSSLNATG